MEYNIEENLRRLKKNFPQVTGRILNEIEANYNKLAYPDHPNWEYCLPIIPNFKYKDSSGEDMTVDIGLHMMDSWIEENKLSIENCLSNNIVYSNDPPDYGSGDISLHSLPRKKLMLKLYEWKILTKMDLLEQFDFNNLIMRFYQSDKLNGWDFQNWINNA